MRVQKRWAVVAGGLALVLVSGCGDLLGLFNGEFLSALGMGSSVASLPGDAPTLYVGIQNGTDKVIEAQLSYRTKDTGVETITTVVEPGQTTAQALGCPIDELTLGSVTDAKGVGARVRLGDGTAADPFIEVEPFGVILKNQVNYSCGDGVTFVVNRSSATRSGYLITAFFQRAGGGG